MCCSEVQSLGQCTALDIEYFVRERAAYYSISHVLAPSLDNQVLHSVFAVAGIMSTAKSLQAYVLMLYACIYTGSHS